MSSLNVLYLLKILNTNKLSELVANIDAPFLDINLSIWEAKAAGKVEIDEKKGRITALVDHEVTFDADLASKLLRVVQHHASEQVNITRGRLTTLAKNAGSEFNYPYHEYLMALQYLIDTGQVLEMVETIPKSGKRPFHRFVFLCLPDNPNEDWNKEEVNKWIANWNKNIVK